MTVEEIRAEVATIKRLAKDSPEHASTVEYELFVDVLQAIGEGDDNDDVELAVEALRATHIDYVRC